MVKDMHTFMKRNVCALGFVLPSVGLPVSPRLSSHLVVRTPAAHLAGMEVRGRCKHSSAPSAAHCLLPSLSRQRVSSCGKARFFLCRLWCESKVNVTTLGARTVCPGSLVI